MKKTFLGAVVACAGAPVVALAVGSATASAATGDPTTPTTTTGGLQVSANGQQLVNLGTGATANSSTGNLAIAYNGGTGSSTATANTGIGNIAFAANNSTATVSGPISSFNTVVAVDNSTAKVNNGSNNKVFAANNSIASVSGTSFFTQANGNTVGALCGGNISVSGSNQTKLSAPCLQ